MLDFGGAALADIDGAIHGGRVKFLHLRDAFETSAECFNILYLVNSAFPPHAAEIAAWAKRNGARVVLNQNGVAFPAWAGTGYLSYNRPYAEVHALADFVFYQSEFCKESSARFLGAGGCPGAIACNCVDTGGFHPVARPENALWRLLTTGTHQQGNRVLRSLEALAELTRRGHSCTLTIAGRLQWPNAMREVRQQINRLGVEDRVELRGQFTQEEAPGMYQNADVLLHLKYADPCPTVVIEALSCGVPVIGSATGGMPELVSPETGVLIAVEKSWLRESWPSQGEIADAVEKIMACHEQFRHAARERALSKFGKEKWIEQHHRVFDELLGIHG